MLILTLRKISMPLVRSRCWRCTLTGYETPQFPPLGPPTVLFQAWTGDKDKLDLFVIYSSNRPFPSHTLRRYNPQYQSCTVDEYLADPLVGAITCGEMPSSKVKHSRQFHKRRRMREAHVGPYVPSKNVKYICIQDVNSGAFSPLIPAYGSVPSANASENLE